MPLYYETEIIQVTRPEKTDLNFGLSNLINSLWLHSILLQISPYMQKFHRNSIKLTEFG